MRWREAEFRTLHPGTPARRLHPGTPARRLHPGTTARRLHPGTTARRKHREKIRQRLRLASAVESRWAPVERLQSRSGRKRKVIDSSAAKLEKTESRLIRGIASM